MEDNKFRLSILSIFDNTLKLTWLASLLIITNFAIIVKKINEFNLNININLLLIISLSLFISNFTQNPYRTRQKYFQQFLLKHLP